MTVLPAVDPILAPLREQSMYRSLLIAVPTTSQSMLAATALSIAGVTKVLTSAGVDVGLHNIDSAEIVTARDMFANMVLHSPAWDALLFIDSDMAFPPRLIERMIALDEPVVAAAYPRRSLDLEIFASGIRQHGDTKRSLAEASSFTLKLAWDSLHPGPIDLRDGFCEAAAVGMGCALISRKAFEKMVATEVVRPRLDLYASGGATCYSFFDNLELAGERLGEDYSFCYRWTHILKQKLWICTDEQISHVGQFEFNASFIDTLAPKGKAKVNDPENPVAE